MKNTKSKVYDSEIFKRWIALNSSVFCYLFLAFFQPFGVNNYKAHTPISVELLLGILPLLPVVFLSIYGSERIIGPIIKDRFRLNLLSWYIIEFFLVGSCSFLLYNALGNFHDFGFKSYALHLLEISSILIFPFAATTFYFKFRNLEKDYQQVLSLSNSEYDLDELLHLTGDYKKDEIALKPKEIVYMAAEDNYVGLNYLDGEILKKYLIRSSLSRMQESLKPNVFLRCHRSYLVNLLHVVSYRKSKNRIWIKLTGLKQEIPVSKSSEKELLKALGKD